MQVVLTIAGSDSGGGAGIQADLKTFCAHRVFGASVLTAVTAQNTRGMQNVEALSVRIVEAQMRSVLSDFDVAVAKTGMLFSAEIVECVARLAREFHLPNLVVDPVMVATSGDRLLQEEAVTAVINVLLPLARVVTPNLPEAEVLTGRPIRTLDDARGAAREIYEATGACAVIKGGHRESNATDVLFDGQDYHEYRAPILKTSAGHGTGCTFSAALAAQLARGCDLPEAVQRAKDYVHAALAAAPRLGHGYGPLNHFVEARL
jgi:hydroxymethylpyrimidine/phosphomethylpyrimidine kinase